ncbi:MAG: hypothetical protein K8R36_14420 [Planctomycetales bacterium]|nr:hypothetical protein [Planctomycetales bacterium]
MRFHAIGLAALFCLGTLPFTGCGNNPVADPLAGVGGYRLGYHPREKRRVEPEEIAKSLRERINAKHASDVVVRPLDDGGCEILLPGVSEKTAADIKRAILLSDLLQFAIVADPNLDRNIIEECAAGKSTEQARWVSYDPKKLAPQPDAPMWKSPQGKSMLLVIEKSKPVDAWHFQNAAVGQDESQRPCLHATLNKDGASRMAKFSSANIKRQLAVIVDGVAISAPTIQSPFSDRFQITGDFDEDELQFLATSLRNARPLGSLEPKPITEEKVAAGSEK